MSAVLGGKQAMQRAVADCKLRATLRQHMFVRMAAQSTYQQVLIRETLQGMPVSRFVTEQAVTVDRDLPVRDLVEDYFYRTAYKMFPVVSAGRLVGCVRLSNVRDLPREQWKTCSNP